MKLNFVIIILLTSLTGFASRVSPVQVLVKVKKFDKDYVNVVVNSRQIDLPRYFFTQNKLKTDGFIQLSLTESQYQLFVDILEHDLKRKK